MVATVEPEHPQLKSNEKCTHACNSQCRIFPVCRFPNALSLSQAESGRVADPRHCDLRVNRRPPRARRLPQDEARAVRVNPVAGAVAFGSRPCRAPSLSRSSTRTRRPGKFPLTRAAARRSRERRERAIGRARIGYSASRAIETPPFVPSRLGRHLRRDHFAPIPSRWVSFCRIVPSGRDVTVSIGRRKCEDCLDRNGHVDFETLSSWRNSDRCANARPCDTCASRRINGVVIMSAEKRLWSTFHRDNRGI